MISMMEMDIDWESLPNFSAFLPKNFYSTIDQSENETSTSSANTRNYSLFIECGKMYVRDLRTLLNAHVDHKNYQQMFSHLLKTCPPRLSIETNISLLSKMNLCFTSKMAG